LFAVGTKNALYLHQGTECDAFFRYCPACAVLDREKFGEAYWHRIHQITGINVCAIHGCLLLKTTVRLHNFNKRVLIAAEEVVPFNLPAPEQANATECQLARYVSALLCVPVNLDNDITIAAFLNAHLPPIYTKGTMYRLSLLLADYQAFYAGCHAPQMDYW